MRTSRGRARAETTCRSSTPARSSCRGQGVARVVATGAHTEIGRIGKRPRRRSSRRPPLQRETRQLVRSLAAARRRSVRGSWCVVYGLTRGDWLARPAGRPHAGDGDAARGVPGRPDHLPRARRLADVAAPGPHAPGAGHRDARRRDRPLRGQDRHADPQPRWACARCRVAGEPLDVRRERERACRRSSTRWSSSRSSPASATPSIRWRRRSSAWATRFLAQTEHLHEDWTLVREYPLSPELLAMSHVWRSRDGRRLRDRGQGRARGDRRPLPPRRRATSERLSRDVAALADEGLRVLGVARAEFHPEALPGGQHDFPFELLGLVGLEDPVRPTCRDAVKECRAAGIRVVMITGDYPGTARNIARQIGLDAGRPGRPAPSWTRWATPSCRRRVRDDLASSPASCPSRSCGWSRRSRPTARSSR